MKNLRKVLAMVLVVATLLSFATVASAAYTDEGKISNNDYAEAVDVLSTIGILNGYEDGSFRPTNNITRAEMAKMIAVLSNKGSDISKLYATANTFADMKGNWAESYVAYCAQTGIVAGRNATTFDPGANVTGLETAKMLLVVLGLDAEKQGYVGANWKVNVLRDAKQFGLLGNFAASYDIAKAITREEAARMMLNALNAPIVVGYVSNNLVTITNKNVPGWTLTDADSITITAIPNDYRLYNNVIVSDRLLGSIYNGLVVDDDVTDCFGRPAVKWTYTNSKGITTVVGTYAKVANKVYTAANTINKDFKTELVNANPVYTVRTYVDGQYTGNTVPTTGNGQRTEVFVDDANKVVTIVVINTYIDTVDGTSTRYGTFTLKKTNGVFDNNYKLAADDVVLFTVCNGDCKDDADVITGDAHLHSAEIVTPVTATVTYTARANGAAYQDRFIADGKEYTYAANLGNVINIGEDILGNTDVNKKKDIYLDKYGYVMHVEDHTEPTASYVGFFVENAWTEYIDTILTPNGGNGYYTNDMVDFDAKATEGMRVDEYLYLAAKGSANKGVLATYTMQGNTAVLKATATPGTANAKVGEAHGLLDDMGTPVTTDDVYATDATKYLIRTYNFATKTYQYEAVTGFRNVKNVYTSANANIQYFVKGPADRVATYVYIDAAYKAETVTFFVTGVAYSAADGSISNKFKGYDVYEAIVNSEKALIAVYNDGAPVAPGTVPVAIEPLKMYKTEKVALGVTLKVDGDLPLYVVDANEIDGVTLTTGQTIRLVDGSHLYDEQTNFKATIAENFKVTNILIANGAVKKIWTDKTIDLEYETTQYWVVMNAAGFAVELIRTVK